MDINTPVKLVVATKNMNDIWRCEWSHRYECSQLYDKIHKHFKSNQYFGKSKNESLAVIDDIDKSPTSPMMI